MTDRKQHFEERHLRKKNEPTDRSQAHTSAQKPSRLLRGIGFLLLVGIAGGGYLWWAHTHQDPDQDRLLADPELPLSAKGKFAVCIGINDYDNPLIPDLSYAEADAVAMRDTLVKYGGFDPDNIRLRLGKEATLRNLRSDLGTWLNRVAGPEDLVIIYISAHGGAEAVNRFNSDDGTSKYFLPVDASPDDLYGTALPMSSLADILSSLSARIKLVCLDTCYSGASGSKSIRSLGMKSTSLSDKFLDKLLTSDGTIVLASSKASQVSLESDVFEQGLFTYFLVQGMTGGADTDADGLVVLPELYQFVSTQVEKQAREMGGRQNVLLRGSFSGLIPITQLSEK